MMITITMLMMIAMFFVINIIAMTTILFSVFIHGISTKPIADSFKNEK